MEELDRAEFIPKELSLQKCSFSFFICICGTIRVKGVKWKATGCLYSRISINLRQTQLLIRFGAVENLSEWTHLFVERDGQFHSLL